MQISPRKTWSQQTLAVKLHAAGEPGFHAAGFERRRMVLLALKTAAAAGLCYGLATLAGFKDGY